MTEKETAKLVNSLQLEYPRDFPENRISERVQLWHGFLGGYPYQCVNEAMIEYMRCDTCQFAPKVGQIEAIAKAKYGAYLEQQQYFDKVRAYNAALEDGQDGKALPEGKDGIDKRTS